MPRLRARDHEALPRVLMVGLPCVRHFGKPQEPRAARKGATVTDVPAHEQKVTHSYTVAYPEHGPRSGDPHYVDFEHWKHAHKADAKCWVGQHIGFDQCTLDQPLEVHHAVIEWSLINGVDFAALEKDYPGISDPSKVGEWVDSSDESLRWLCQFHHRGHGGAHVASHSDWTAQCYVKDLLS